MRLDTALCCRSEFTFRMVYGRIPEVIEHCVAIGVNAAGITDRGGAWGHFQWRDECEKHGIKPLFGVELCVVLDSDENKKQPKNYMRFLALNNKGVRQIYKLIQIATERFYYEPRLDYALLEPSDDVLMLSGPMPNWNLMPKGTKNCYAELCPGTPLNMISHANTKGWKIAATSNNFYPIASTSELHEVIAHSSHLRVGGVKPYHILSDAEWRNWASETGYPKAAIDEALHNAHEIGKVEPVKLQKAQLVQPDKPKSIREMCIDAAPSRNVDLSNKVYADRLDRELDLITRQQFEDYFHIVADICQWARQRMLVGPARGSSCGSLVCYLLEITEIDPIEYDLIFERFVDINRADMPDIDIDFPDSMRDDVIKYIHERYGDEHVSKLGTINTYKPKSAVTEVAKMLHIPDWEVRTFKDGILQRSGGDARAKLCILDSFAELEVGQTLANKYPELKSCAMIEGHARHSGQHAAGIIITREPITHHCAIDSHSDNVQIEKKDAEKMNLLKIDLLGLRTLSIIQDALSQIGMHHKELIAQPKDDVKVFDIINQNKQAGIFQLEGIVVQSFVRRMVIEHFEDIVALTAISRPGPINSGATAKYLDRRMGRKPVEYLHEMARQITECTYGIVVYQEQVMNIARHIGGLSWEDVSSLRKAMSKSLGKEFFDNFWQAFKVGAAKHGIQEDEAETIWSHINTMGSWAFNRSHAVAYSTITYWCAWLKAYHPLQFAASILRHAKDDEQVITVLREMTNEGCEYTAIDPKHSQANWSVHEGKLVGGLTGIKGIGPKLAEQIVQRRSKGTPYTPRQKALLEGGQTEYDSIYPCRDLWGHILDEPGRYNIQSKIIQIGSINIDDNNMIVFIGKLANRNLRDHNEVMNIHKRGGKRLKGNTLYLTIRVGDDTGSIICTIGRAIYPFCGKQITETDKIGDWYLIKGWKIVDDMFVRVNRIIKLTGNPKYQLTQ